MRKIKISLLVLLLLGFVVSGASAVDFTMFESDFNFDGTIIPTFSGPILAPITYIETFNTPGAHYGAVFVDPEIDEAINTFSNEVGSVVGSPAAGQSFEIDEPGFGNPVTMYLGNIFDNFKAGTLDNMIFDGTFTGPEDVSMALGWNFILAAGETATVRFIITPQQPASGFYLVQTDPDSQASLYFYSTLDIRQEGGEVPEPATMFLLGSGLAGLIGFGRKKLFRK